MSDNLTNKFLIFNINEENYCIPIAKVRQVVRYVTITPIHDASDFLKGVINLRGKIIPIIDMKVKFGLAETEYTDRTVFIIVDVQGMREVYNIGITVDAVQDVVDITGEEMETTPNIGLKLKSQYLDGIAKIGDHMVMVLNIDKILTSDEIVDVGKIGTEEAENQPSQ